VAAHRIILGYLAHGEPVDVILREFPSLTEVPSATRVAERVFEEVFQP
jgi:uncharacterized protein (DUF433 family)